MKSNYLSGSIIAITLLASTAGFVRAADNPAKNTDTQKAARLFRDIQTDAAQVRSASMHLASIVGTSGATWLEYDRQWNEIKPSVERMQINLARLDAMQGSLTQTEKTDLDQSKALIEQIQGRTHQLRVLLDKPGVQTTDKEFKVFARGLENESTKLEKAAKIG